MGLADCGGSAFYTSKLKCSFEPAGVVAGKADGDLRVGCVMKCDGNFDESDFVSAVANNASVVICVNSNDSGFDARDVA